MSLLVSYLYGCLCAFVPCAAYLFVARRGKSRSQGLVLALYPALVMAVTGAGTLWDLLRPSEPGYSNIILNFQPLANGLRRDICLNVVMLVPLGFLLPLWWRDYQRLAPTVVAGAGLSLLIEVSQLMNGRATDIDDLIANTLGALAGYLLWCLLGKKDEAPRHDQGLVEPLFLVLLCFVGRFLLFNEGLVL